MRLLKIFKIWADVIKNPIKTFKKEAQNPTIKAALKNMVISGVIIGLILGIITAMNLISNAATLATLNLSISMNLLIALIFLLAFAIAIVGSILGLLIGSAIFYAFSRLLKGKGNYTTQTYLIAIYSAPMGIILTIFNLIPYVGPILSFLFSLYGIYLLTMALRTTHKFRTTRAILAWLLPFVIITLIVVVCVLMLRPYIPLPQ